MRKQELHGCEVFRWLLFFHYMGLQERVVEGWRNTDWLDVFTVRTAIFYGRLRAGF